MFCSDVSMSSHVRHSKYVWQLSVRMMSWLEYNSVEILDFCCFDIGSCRNVQKIRIKSSSNNLFGLKCYYIHSRDHSKFWRKSQGLSIDELYLTQYMRNSDMGYVLKMEYVSKINIFGQKMMVKSGLEKIFLKFLHAQGFFQTSWFTS